MPSSRHRPSPHRHWPRLSSQHTPGLVTVAPSCSRFRMRLLWACTLACWISLARFSSLTPGQGGHGWAYVGGILMGGVWEAEGGHVGSWVKGWCVRRSQGLQWGSPQDQERKSQEGVLMLEFGMGREP